MFQLVGLSVTIVQSTFGLVIQSNSYLNQMTALQQYHTLPRIIFFIDLRFSAI